MIPGIVAQQAGIVQTGSKWWRVRFPSGRAGSNDMLSSNPYIDIRFISMATSIGGTNLVPDYLDINSSFVGNDPTNAVVDNSSVWGNGGIGPLVGDMWAAFKLPTEENIDEVKIRNHSVSANYSPFIVVVESSLDGINWTFEWGEARLVWGSAELKTFTRPSIDWSTATYRDWLFQPVITNGLNNLGIFEMEMADSIGGVDLCTGGTPKSTNNGTYPASNLTDNNTSSLCGSLGQQRFAYVGYVFPSAVKIDEIRCTNHNSEGIVKGFLCVGTGTPGTFTGPWIIKQECDGVVNQGSAAWTNYDMRNPREPAGAAGAHQYWRVRAGRTGNLANGSYFACSKLDFKTSGVSLTGSGTPMSSTQFDASHIDDNAFDSDDTTKWASTQTWQTFQWIGYNFGSAVLPDEIFIQARNDAFWNQMFATITIDWSDDGIFWYEKETFEVTEIAGATESQSFLLAA